MDLRDQYKVRNVPRGVNIKDAKFDRYLIRPIYIYFYIEYVPLRKLKSQKETLEIKK